MLGAGSESRKTLEGGGYEGAEFASSVSVGGVAGPLQRELRTRGGRVAVAMDFNGGVVSAFSKGNNNFVRAMRGSS